jgi:putative aldouronate transport system permease protein
MVSLRYPDIRDSIVNVIMESLEMADNKLSWGKYLRRYYQLYLLVLPSIVFIFIFAYIPMYGAQIAFKNFTVNKGIWGSDWVGLKHFVRFITSSNFWPLLRNTVGINLYSLVVGFPVPIVLAFVFNELRSRKFAKTVQMITYAPHFISVVAIGGLTVMFLQRETGLFNLVRIAFGAKGYDFLSDPKWFKTIYVFSGIWQEMGWGSVIYLAALSAVDPQIAEAARIDGASRIQKILYVDFPSILPTVIILLILQAGSLLSIGFEKILLLQNQMNIDSSDVFATYIYRLGIENAQFSFTTAVGLFNSIINMLVLIAMNKLSSRLTGSSLW